MATIRATTPEILAFGPTVRLDGYCGRRNVIADGE
jgi:hypothetical protein